MWRYEFRRHDPLGKRMIRLYREDQNRIWERTRGAVVRVRGDFFAMVGPL